LSSALWSWLVFRHISVAYDFGPRDAIENIAVIINQMNEPKSMNALKAANMRRRRRCLATLFFASFLFLNAAQSATYYVSPSGSNSADGSEAHPWQTLQKGLDSAQPGDIIQLLSGSFTAAASRRDGTASNPITILGETDLSAVITGNGGNSTSQAVYITHANYVVKYLYCDGARILLSGDGAHHCVIEHNTIRNAYNGVAHNGGIEGPHNNVIRNNDISHWKSNGALLINGHDSIFAHNKIHDNDGWDAVRAFGYNQTISHNEFANINPDLVGGNHGDVIQTFGNTVTGGTKAYNIIFERNVIKDSAAQWATLQAYDTPEHPNPDVRDWVFRNNLTYGVGCRMHVDLALPGTQFYNNVFYHSTGTDSIRLGYNIGNVANNTKIKNNLLIECGSTSQNGFYTQPTGLVGVEYDYNFVSGQGGAPKSNFHETHGINGGTGAQVFVNPSGTAPEDFELKLGSPAIGMALDLSLIAGFSDDLNGASRTGLWDMGAFMFGVTPPRNLHLTSR
jgi:hypothetical protein